MKAIALISGGLDSALACRLIQAQGIEMIPLSFKIPFCKKKEADPFPSDLKIIDISRDFLDLLIKPRYGFGSNMNPCIDCKIFMLTRARELMKEWNATFVVTGEVLGQRPMSQHRQALEIIEKRSGLEGLVLRPLSARLLKETIPEKEGWVDRNRLLDFSGRTRKPQMKLADEFKIKEYPNPAGGCLLTDPEFSKRLKELIEHRELSLENIELLKVGRHFRISPETKLAVGRNEKENEQLANLAKGNDYLFMPRDIAGPTALGRGKFNDDLIKLAANITCRYCDLDGKMEADIIYKTGTVPAGDCPCFNVTALSDQELKILRV